MRLGLRQSVMNELRKLSSAKLAPGIGADNTIFLKQKIEAA